MDYFRRLENFHSKPLPENDSESEPDADLYTPSEQLEAFEFCQPKLHEPCQQSIKVSAPVRPAKLADFKRRKRQKISSFTVI